ncbi:MAG TPA: HEPN domain-containing protein [Phycisphaerae bacterium]|nr:HEPN domain-containing protein [Phycisphaerae bacterium]
MTADESIASQVRAWVQKAEHDLMNASHTLKLGRKCPTETVAFHAQQCAEKYIKALLVWRKKTFPRTHDIALLMELLPAGCRVFLESEWQELLTDYAVTTRYPGDDEPITLAQARQAVNITRRIRKQIRELLPQEALRKL